MIAIWPAGPPKLINPSFTQNQKASRNPTSLPFRSSPCPLDSYEVFTVRYSNRGYTEGQVTARSRIFRRGWRRLVEGAAGQEHLIRECLAADQNQKVDKPTTLMM